MVRVPVWLAIGISVVGLIALLTGGLTGPERTFVFIVMGATALYLLDWFIQRRRTRSGGSAGRESETWADELKSSTEQKVKVRHAATMAALRDLRLTERQLDQLQWVYLDQRYDQFHDKRGLKPGLALDDVFGVDFERWVRSRAIQDDPIVDDAAAEAAKARVKRRDEKLYG